MKPIVVKVGGSTLGAHDTAIEDIAALSRAGRDVVVVHGGGNAATEWLKVHGIASEFLDGLRVTGPEAIDVVTAVFAGLVNKHLVADLQAKEVRAAGIAGVDGKMLATARIDERLGFVGEITTVDTSLLTTLLDARFVPVVSPIAFWADCPRQLMNVNADTVAGEVAVALGAQDLVFLTDVPGVKDASGEWANHLDADSALEMVRAGTAAGGMAPKLLACVRAARAGVPAVIVDGREAHALTATLDGNNGGTRILPFETRT